MNSVIKKFITKFISHLIISLNNANIETFNKRRIESIPTSIFPKILLDLDMNIARGRILSVNNQIIMFF